MFDDFHNVKCIIINFPNQNSIYLFIVALYGSTINNNNNLLGIYHFFISRKFEVIIIIYLFMICYHL